MRFDILVTLCSVYKKAMNCIIRISFCVIRKRRE